MKLPKTKRDLRAEHDRLMAEYLQAGGEVKEVAPGGSGRGGASGPLTPRVTRMARNQRRTPVDEVVAAVEARRQGQPAKTQPQPKRQPRKRIVLDDFGQPLRWEWVED